MRLQVSPPIICISSETEYSLHQSRIILYITVFAFLITNLGLSISVLALHQTRQPEEIYWTSGSCGIISALFCALWIVYLFQEIQRRHIDIRILDEKLLSISTALNTRYIPHAARYDRALPEQIDNYRWSKFMDISKSLKQYRWEAQVFLIALFLLNILDILFLTCLQVNSYVAAFVILAIALLVAIYSIFRFTMLGILPISTVAKILKISTSEDSDYANQLDTLFEFMETIGDPIFWMLYVIFSVAVIFLYIISLFYLST